MDGDAVGEKEQGVKIAMKILRISRTFSADHSEGDYQYVTWEPREDVDSRTSLKVGEGNAQVLFEKTAERAALLVGVLMLKQFREMGGTLVGKRVLDGVVKKLSEDFSEDALAALKEESKAIMSWLESGEVETDESYYDDFWFERPRHPEHAYSTTETVPLIEQAIEGGFDLEIEYYARSQGEFTTRRITPESFDGDMLYAYCHLRKEDRMFKTSRIKSIKKVKK